MQMNDLQNTSTKDQRETIAKIVTNMKKVFELEDRYLDSLAQHKLSEKIEKKI